MIGKNSPAFRLVLVAVVACLLVPQMALAKPAKSSRKTPSTAPAVVDNTPLPSDQAVAAGDLLAARAQLSTAMYNGELSAAQQKRAARVLSQLAQQTLYSSKIIEGDPYTFSYQMKPGETVNSAAAKLGLHVPASTIAAINGVKDGNVAAGQQLKMIRGSVNAVINKSSFSLDLYLVKAGEAPAFLKRIRVAIGKNNGTPTGNFRVYAKVVKPSWTPPPSSGHKEKLIKYGEKGYPFGKLGLWLGLKGDDETTASCKGYALHSTNDQGSIGQARSLGCIRIGDNDIPFVYATLREGSKVTIRP